MVRFGTHAVVAKLAAFYSPPEYAFFREVGNSTGATERRWADGLAISLWPSRGITIDAFEVKVSRGDWLKELRDPSKAEAIAQYCDRFWLVVNDPKIVKAGELPKTWGLLVVDDDGIRREIEAPQLSPVGLDRAFVAAIARRAAEQSADAKVAKSAYAEGFRAGEAKERGRSKDGAAAESLKKLTDRVYEFQKASGVSFAFESQPGRIRQIGEAVAHLLRGDQVMAGRLRTFAGELSKLVAHVKTVADQCELPKGAK